MLYFVYYVLPNGTFSDISREKMTVSIKQEGNDKKEAVESVYQETRKNVRPLFRCCKTRMIV